MRVVYGRLRRASSHPGTAHRNSSISAGTVQSNAGAKIVFSHNVSSVGEMVNRLPVQEINASSTGGIRTLSSPNPVHVRSFIRRSQGFEKLSVGGVVAVGGAG